MAAVKHPPRVSAITIFLNAARFIDEAIESVFRQTFTDWELLLVDDGSTDASSAIARDWAARHPDRVRVLEHESHQNRGMSASRNLGVAHARGSLIAFLDADDVWLPSKLERQVAILGDHPAADMICGPTLWWHSWHEHPAEPDAVRELRIPVGRVFDPPALLEQFVEGKIETPATCTALIRRQAILDAGGFEDRFTGMFEDQVFFAKLYRHGRVFASGELLDYYRQHDGSHCHVADTTPPYHWEDGNPHREAFKAWLRAYVNA